MWAEEDRHTRACVGDTLVMWRRRITSPSHTSTYICPGDVIDCFELQQGIEADGDDGGDDVDEDYEDVLQDNDDLGQLSWGVVDDDDGGGLILW